MPGFTYVSTTVEGAPKGPKDLGSVVCMWTPDVVYYTSDPTYYAPRYARNGQSTHSSEHRRSHAAVGAHHFKCFFVCVLMFLGKQS